MGTFNMFEFKEKICFDNSGGSCVSFYNIRAKVQVKTLTGLDDLSVNSDCICPNSDTSSYIGTQRRYSDSSSSSSSSDDETGVRRNTAPVTRSQSVKCPEGICVEYQVFVKTSNKLFSGTDDNVKIKLIGSLAESKWVALNNKWNNDFEAGDTNKFEIGFKRNLGYIKTIQLTKDGSNDWKCDEVKLTSSIDPSGKTSDEKPWESVFIFDQKIGLKPVESKNKPLFKFIE